MDWVVEASICQRQGDFVYDAASQTLCCPSPDHCCPNSVGDCAAAPRAGLFDAARLPAATLNGSFRAWFASRKVETLCPVGQWNGATCNWVFTNESYGHVVAAWRGESGSEPT